MDIDDDNGESPEGEYKPEMEGEKSTLSKVDQEKFCARARERFRRSWDFWKPLYDLADSDKKFYAGNSDNGFQWPQEITELMNPKKPRLTINRLIQFHNQIVNDYRQSTIGMRAAPQNDEDADVAYTYAGLFKQIEKQSNAQIAYITALSNAAIGGLGWLRVAARYASKESWNQDLYIDRIVNPSRCIADPDATGFFMEDANFFFFIDNMREEDYEDLYGRDPSDFVSDDFNSDWYNEQEKTVQIAEYFYFKSQKRELWLLQDGSSIFKDEIDEQHIENATAAKIKSRMVDDRVLYWCKLDGYNVLEEKKWPRNRIPFAPVWGNELWIGDTRTFEGQVRGVKDSQRQYNYMQSAKTEMIAIAPRAPYIAAEGQLENREQEWIDAATTAKSVLYYKPMTVDGVIVPPPQRQAYEAPVQAIIQASLQASDDMKAVLGVYDASLGARGNEVSGRAIDARKREGDTATYNFVDNLGLGIGYTGTIVAELIPVYYDAQRRIRIITPEGDLKVQGINGPNQPNLVSVQYDLVLDTGPSFETQRSESVAIITELSHNFPKLLEVGGDIAVGQMNFKGAREIAERLKRTLPPEVVGDEEDATIKLAAVTTQFNQAQAIVKALTEELRLKDTELTEAQLAVKNKAGELRIKQQEVAIKRQELQLKREEMLQNGDNDAAKHDAIKSDESDVLDQIGALSAQVAELADMIEAVVHEDTSGASSDAPSPGVAPSPGTPPSPVNPSTPSPQEEPTDDDQA